MKVRGGFQLETADFRDEPGILGSSHGFFTTARPTLPTTSVGLPACLNISPVSTVVVVLPLVPVIAT